MEKPTLNSEERIVSLNDVKQFYISMWRGLIKWVFLGALLAFLYFGNSTPKYKAQASFKEAMEKASPETFFSALMAGVSAVDTPQASSLMRSYQVLRPLVEKMGLQINFSPSREWVVKRIIRHFRETLRAEKGLKLEDLDPFVFQEGSYEEEIPFSFTLFFTDLDHFILYSDDKKKELCKGQVGSPVSLYEPEVRFTLAKTPKKLKIGIFYPFQMVHWSSAARALRSAICIKSDKDNPSVINISVLNRDRHLATRLVNELMCQYQLYLKREYDHVAQKQLAYLEGRQEQAFGKMEQLFDQHVVYLGENLKENGLIGLEQETQNFLAPHQQMYTKVLAIEMDLSLLNQIGKEEKAVAMAGNSSCVDGFNSIFQDIRGLKRQRDLLELSLYQLGNFSLEERRRELKEVRDQRFAVEKLLQEVDLRGEISFLEGSQNLNQALYLWAKNLRDPEEREGLAEYLENYARILSMREKMLQERFIYGHQVPSELDGIDLPAAQELLLEYNNRLDAAEATMCHYEQFKKEVHDPNFDVASLSSVLRDPLCQKIITRASELNVQLKDDKHHTSKEANRWGEEIALQKKILSDQLEQLYKVEELNASLIREKMRGLQQISLDCINRQISVLYEQVHDSIKERRQALCLEKALLEKKMEEMRLSFAAALPEKWRFEKWLDFKTTMVTKIMETVTGIVESKTISDHLHHVESKPLDCALVPLVPERPRLRPFTILGAFALPFLIFSLAFIRQILKGFPISLEKLKALHFQVLGPVSAFCDGPSVGMPTGSDLELLRQLAIFIEGKKVIGLIGGRGPDYSYALGENLARMSAKLIILRCDFLSKFRKEDTPGLLQVWKGEIGELPIRKGKGFDYITAGGFSPFGTEVIQSQNFSQLVDLLKEKYDWVFLLVRSPLVSAESVAALRLCEKAVVTISGEQTEELTPFANWAYHEDRCRLTFIARL